VKSCRRGDVVWFETKSGRRRLGLVDKVEPNEYPPRARVRPYIAARQKYGGWQKVPLTAILKRADNQVRAEVEAALSAGSLFKAAG